MHLGRGLTFIKFCYCIIIVSSGFSGCRGGKMAVADWSACIPVPSLLLKDLFWGRGRPQRVSRAPGPAPSSSPGLAQGRAAPPHRAHPGSCSRCPGVVVGSQSQRGDPWLLNSRGLKWSKDNRAFSGCCVEAVKGHFLPSGAKPCGFHTQSMKAAISHEEWKQCSSKWFSVSASYWP